MERSTCSTTVADGFGRFAVLVVFCILPTLQRTIPEKKTGGKIEDIFFLEKSLKFLGMLLHP